MARHTVLQRGSLVEPLSATNKTLVRSGSGQRPVGKRKLNELSLHQQDQKRRRQRVGPASPASERQLALLNEIRALSGDDDDLELVTGVDSESDAELGDDGGQDTPQGFREELHDFATELGFRQSAMPVPTVEVGGVREENDLKYGLSHSLGGPRAQAKAGRILAFEPRADWHAAHLPELPAPVSPDISSCSRAIESLKQYSRKLLEDEGSKYASSVLASSSHKFLSTIMVSGTMTDKVSALTLAIQESPIHNVKSLEALLNLASKKARTQAIIALNAIVDLLGPGLLLPSDRRLRSFHLQPGLLGALQRASVVTWNSDQMLPGRITSTHLIHWAYEDWLKDAYFRLIQQLEILANDEIEYSRIRSLDLVFGLLREKPEQEANLLKLLVNKLGDKDRKLASRSSHLLLQMQTIHPGMKAIIVRTIEQEVLLRPGTDYRTRCYAVNTLNQTILSSKEPAVAEMLLKIYFEMFGVFLKTHDPESSHLVEHESLTTQKVDKDKSTKKNVGGNVPDQESKEKLVAAILTGINRAVPFAVADGTLLDSQLDTLFRIAHSPNFNTSIQALSLLQQLLVSKTVVADRFYRTLYESLLDPRLTTTSKHAMYLNLLLRSLRGDNDSRRVKAFVKRMLQVLTLHQPPFACGLIYVIIQLQRVLPDLGMLLTEPEDLADESESGLLGGVSRRPSVSEPGRPEDATARVYDGRKRDPEHSNAHRSCLWEAVPSLVHYHPAVVVYATSMMNLNDACQKPDIDSHTLIRFLDKFVYRNPKSGEPSKGGSIMQSLHAKDDIGRMLLRSTRTPGHIAGINSSTFWNKSVEEVAPEDVFFHKYFSQTSKPGRDPRAADGDTTRDEEYESDREFLRVVATSEPEDEDLDSDPAFDMSDFVESDIDSMDSKDDVENSSRSLRPSGSEECDAGTLASTIADPGGDGQGTKDLGHLGGAGGGKLSRKQLKGLPTFASVDDYAMVLSEEDIS